MTNRRHFLLALLFATALAAGASVFAQPFHGPSVPVQGQLLSRAQGPVPGVTAFLLHPVLGRSTPSYTDIYGRFGWTAIPIRPEPYFLEIYWGQNLIYRQPIRIGAPTQLPPILL